MHEHLADVFEKTMKALEKSLQVRLIASCPLDARQDRGPVDESFERAERLGYDVIGERRGGKIVAVLDRLAWKNNLPFRRPVLDTMLISANAPLSEALARLADDEFLLVTEDTAIVGIVTRSDLLKLPVRLLVFAHVTHLELILAKAIRSKPLATPDAWLELLSEPRRDRVLKKLEDLKKQRLDPPLLECTDFCDKRIIVRQLYHPPKGFSRDLEDVEKFLRNPVAHGGTFVQKDGGPARLIELLTKAKHWSDEVRKLYRG
jgi:hypothetical protein